MEELRDINFQALIEGQDYEKSLKKIVSTYFTTFSASERKQHFCLNRFAFKREDLCILN